MSGKAPPPDPYVEVTQKPQDMTNPRAADPEHPKAREARLEASASAVNGESSSSAPPPQYTPTPSSPPPTDPDAAPPRYDTLSAEATHSMHTLSTGDPAETISVPMVLSTEKRSKKNFLTGRRGDRQYSVTVRKMKRSFYLEHYAKDAEGRYVGTGTPAADAGLVFVPGKSSDEDLVKQVMKVAFGRSHDARDFGGSAFMGGGFTGGGGGA